MWPHGQVGCGILKAGICAPRENVPRYTKDFQLITQVRWSKIVFLVGGFASVIGSTYADSFEMDRFLGEK